MPPPRFADAVKVATATVVAQNLGMVLLTVAALLSGLVIALLVRARSSSRYENLGSVSERWIAEQRASSTR